MADEMRYFQCRPGELCKAADCCRNTKISLELGLGDYLRLSQITHRSAEELWREYGDVHLTDNEQSNINGIFLIRLGLKAPCPFVSDKPDYRCRVYDSRPLNCAQFPLGTLKNNPQKLEQLGYACLRDAQASPDQINFLYRLTEIYTLELMMDDHFLWSDVPLLTPPFWDLKAEVEYIVAKQKRNDPNLQTHATRNLMEAMKDFNTMADPAADLDPHKYMRLLRALMFCRYEDEIAKQLTGVQRFHSDNYAETSKRWEALLKEMSFQQPK